MAEIGRDQLEDIVETKVREIAEEKQGERGMVLDEEEVARKISESIKQNSESGQEEALIAQGLSRDMPRRKFLKLIGLGGLGLMTASNASAGWAQWRPGNQGTSDIDATTIDGHKISVGSSKPGSPSSDEIFYDTSGDGVHYYNGSSWTKITNSSFDTTIQVNGNNQGTWSQSSNSTYNVSVSSGYGSFNWSLIGSDSATSTGYNGSSVGSTSNRSLVYVDVSVSNGYAYVDYDTGGGWTEWFYTTVDTSKTRVFSSGTSFRLQTNYETDDAQMTVEESTNETFWNDKAGSEHVLPPANTSVDGVTKS